MVSASVIASRTLGSGPPGTSLLASLIAPWIVRPGTYFGNDSRSDRGVRDGIVGLLESRWDSAVTVSRPDGSAKVPNLHLEVIA
ncbi:hypothetical protein GCM10022222_21080 [Amycolatopsis ultiminotia]|uniref:Uncharacterized protein n=1 Tax=Amycolatopsis ultiminotia TaxID=543629 RepID=A0ABP6VNC1_9PSEU